MPSVLRTVSFWPFLVVVSLSKQRVSPLVSTTTAFWASVVRSEVKSKCTLLTGNTKSSYKKTTTLFQLVEVGIRLSSTDQQQWEININYMQSEKKPVERKVIGIKNSFFPCIISLLQ